MKKTPLKRGNSVLKRGSSPLKGKTLRKRSIASQLKEATSNGENYEQKIMFERIWKPLRPNQRICYETGVFLGWEPLTVFFHHVLPKELYPQFKFSPWNIILVSLATHDQYHTFPERCPKIYALYQSFLAKLPNLQP